MKQDEALDIVQMLVARWPGAHWSKDTMDAYAYALEAMDAKLTTLAVLRAERELEFYPKLATLRELVRIEKALAAPEPPADRMASVPDFKRDIPAWVRRWVAARAHGDMRVFPEQKPGYDTLQIQEPAFRTYVWPDQEPMPADAWLDEAENVTDSQVWKAVGA